MGAVVREKDVPIECRRVGALRAAMWFVLPFLPGPLVYCAISAAVWLRAEARGQGEFTLFLVVVGFPIWVAVVGRATLRAFREARENRVCVVVPPRRFLARRAGLGAGEFAGLVASAPLCLRDGRLTVRDRGAEHDLVGAVDRVVLGVFRGRWCCFAEFGRGEQIKRVQALGVLPSVFRSDGASIES